MPKCSKCGKNFKSLQALNDHFRSMHPNERFIPPKSTNTRNLLVIVIIVIIVMGSAVGYLIFLQLNQPTTTTTTQPGSLRGAISTALYQNLTGVSDSTLASVGSGQGITAPTRVSGSPLINNGKPEVLYIGGEFCPFCAAERWSMIVALSKFGTFAGLAYMLSAPSPESYPNTATFSFYNTTFTSQYISFVSVEEFDRSHNTINPLTSTQSSLINKYDSGANIPFIDMNNTFTVVGAQYSPQVLANLNWTQIASQLNNPSSTIAQSINGAANTLISAICKIDGGNPSSVCGQSFAQLSLLISPGTLGLQGIPVIAFQDYTSGIPKPRP